MRINTLLALCLFCSFFAAKAQPQILLEQYASGFSFPVDIANANDDRLFVVERAGRIKIIDGTGNTLATPFLDIVDQVHSFGGQGEIGLLGMTFHPDFANNGYFYVHYTNLDDHSNIARFTVEPGTPNVVNPNTELLLMTINQPFLNHNGGCLKFGPDGYLYIGMGDGGSAGDPQNNSQNTNSLLGKMLRIDVDNGSPYSIPPSNPFVGNADVLDEIWAIGLRNPWRFSFDQSTGDLWIGDVGQGAREEIDMQGANSTGGENYGWRCYEGSVAFNTSGCGAAGDYTAALHDYNHSGGSCSVTGGYVYRGVEYSALIGTYIYGDYCSGRIWTLTPDGAGGYNNNLSNTFGGYDISTFGEDAQGEMYLARMTSGIIYKLGVDACASFAANATVVDEACNGTSDGSITLSLTDGTPPFTYAWSNGANTDVITNLTEGTYIVTITDDEQCQLIETFELVNGTPSGFTIMADGPLEFCEGDSVTLSTAEAPPGYTIQWNLGNFQIAGANETTLTVFTDPGNYYVTYLNGPCPVPNTSNWLWVNVLDTPDDPVINLEGPEVLCPNEFTTIAAEEAPTDYGYQWYRGGDLLMGETNMGLITDQPGNYYVVYTGQCETNTSNWIEITLDDGPPPVINQSDNTLSVNDIYDAYQWYLDGSPIFGANEAFYEATETGEYYVEIMTTNDCNFNSNVVSVSVTNVFPLAQLTNVVISPNPFTDKIRLEISVSEASDLKISVHDVKGVEQHQEVIQVNQYIKKELLLEKLPSGVYFVTIQSGDKVFTKKVIRE